MNMISILKKINQKNIVSIFAVLFVMVTIFAYTTNIVFACHCESITASPSSIMNGEQSTLEWSFAVGEGDVSVTIDELPGQEWTGDVGTTVVFPEETTTYHAHAHKNGMDDVDCFVTVTVLHPEPTVPVCPFTENDNVTVIDFNGGKTRDESLMLCSNNCSNRDIVKYYNISAGKYSIQTASWDGYSDRVNVSQPNEQFNVEFRNGEDVLGTAGPTTDLTDNVLEDTKIDTFTEAITTSVDANKIAVTHAFYPDDSSSNSVIPVCVAIKKEVTVEEPWCEMNINPNSIENGNFANLSWNSEFVTKVDITNVGTDLDSNGAITISPSATTTYTGTFYTNNNSELTCSATIIVTPKNTDNTNPSCTITATPSRVDKGGNITISWTSVNATSGVIDNGIGEVNLSGSKKVVVNNFTTYTGTFSNNNGKKVTCSTKVRINGGGGGSCMNCDKKKDSKKEVINDKKDKKATPPSIVLGKTTKKTGKRITLDQVPYTGFEAGPVLTTFFWLTVLMVSGLVAYVLTVIRPLDRIRSVLINKDRNIHTLETNTTNILLDEVSDNDKMLGISSAMTNNENNHDDGFGLIENMAHKENILLSPEALRLIHSNMGKSEDREEYLKSIFNKTKTLYPREDGWILISKERANELFDDNLVEEKNNNKVSEIENTLLSEEKPFRVEQQQISKQDFATKNRDEIQTNKNENNNTVDDIVFIFIKKLVDVKKKDVFDLLRNITSKGVDVGSFISMVVRQLDEVYKHKIEGNHNPNNELIKLTNIWTDDDFETILGILVECIDYSYSNNRIGTKIALAKAFEYFERKKA